MPDYASILKRSVSALPDPTPEMREAVYQRARAALARQLTAVDPPLSSREIETQHQELEDAVARLEAEFAPQAPPPPEPSYEPPKDEFVFTPPAAEPAPPPPPRHAAPVPPVPPVRDDIAEDIADEFEADDDEEDEYDDDEDRASRTPALIGLLVVILVVVGIGGYAYSQREAVLGLFGFGSDETMEASPAEVAPQDDDAGDKIADRLTNGPESPPEPQESTDSVMIVPTPEEAEDTTPPTEAVEPEGGQLASAETGDVGTSLVGQRAIYYYQGAEGQAGEALDGTVSWAEITKDGQPAIRATIRIPENDVQVTVTIYKNYDETLPANQMVEIQFSGSLGASPVQRVPALVLKQTEQARGQPLAGAAVPVTNELFWIALSDDDEQSARNVQLLKEGSWFDVPILFSDQTRALFTFEKGIPGDKVFETVMASWTP
jgi:hypothetical protein